MHYCGRRATRLLGSRGNRAPKHTVLALVGVFAIKHCLCPQLLFARRCCAPPHRQHMHSMEARASWMAKRTGSPPACPCGRSPQRRHPPEALLQVPASPQRLPRGPRHHLALPRARHPLQSRAPAAARRLCGRLPTNHHCPGAAELLRWAAHEALIGTFMPFNVTEPAGSAT